MLAEEHDFNPLHEFSILILVLIWAPHGLKVQIIFSRVHHIKQGLNKDLDLFKAEDIAAHFPRPTDFTVESLFLTCQPDLIIDGCLIYCSFPVL